MKIIETLSDKIGEEINDAHSYISLAMQNKDEHPALADVFYKLSTEEMGHMQALHAAAVKLIEDYKTTHGDPPPAMLAVYNYLHDKNMHHAAEVKAAQALYRGE